MSTFKTYVDISQKLFHAIRYIYNNMAGSILSELGVKTFSLLKFFLCENSIYVNSHHNDLRYLRGLSMCICLAEVVSLPTRLWFFNLK